jgi:uncharacterized protein (DUF1778 family)
MESKKQSDIHIRCSLEQKNQIKSEADKLGLTISDYLLNSKSNTFLYRKDILNLVECLSYNDNKLDNNVNQIAKNFNTNGFVVDDNVLKELLNLLSSVGKKREDLITKLNKLIKILSE